MLDVLFTLQSARTYLERHVEEFSDCKCITVVRNCIWFSMNAAAMLCNRYNGHFSVNNFAGSTSVTVRNNGVSMKARCWQGDWGYCTFLYNLWWILPSYHSTFNLFVCCEGEPEELIKHGLRALRETLPNEQELTTKVQL